MFSVELSVRDYECDIQGIVNNSVYLNYLEHARHKFIESKGHKFIELHQSGIDIVLSKIEVSYKKSLRANTQFIVYVKSEWKSPARIVFHQKIETLNKEVVLTATVTAVCVIDKRPKKFPKELEILADIAT